MRIAFIVRSFPKISETFILNQIVGLIERGYKVHIYSIYPGEKDIVHLEYKQYKLFEKTYYLPQVPENPSLRIIKAIYSLITNYGYISRSIKSLNIFKYGRAATLLYLFYFSSLIKERRDYDIIHCHFGICGLVGVALRDLGLLTGKIITSFHGMDVNIYPRLYGKNVYSQLFNQGDLYTVNSNYTSKKLVGLGCPKHKITKLCVGVNISQYSFREKFLSSGENIKILTVARLVEKKGIEYSIKAVAKVIQNYPDIQYHIVGDGILRKSLELLIDELGASQQIKLLGTKTKEEILHLYHAAHLFILSSVTSKDGDQEGQGLVLQEAQAAGLPVLSTWHNGIPEGVLSDRSGFLVPEKDVDALAKRLSYLLEHPEIWSNMGKAGRAFVEANYALDILNDRLVEIYQGLIDES